MYIFVVFFACIFTLVYAKPNILIFLVDDFGWGDLGANIEGDTSYTPFMDEFVKDGIRFTDFHVGASVCTPSRAALLTGRSGLRTGVNMLFGAGNVGGLPLTEMTITDLLKQHGYRTFQIGKWHLGHHSVYSPTQRGFDHYYGVPYSLDQGCLDYTPHIHPSRQTCKNQSSNLIGVPLYRDEAVIKQPLPLRDLSNLYIEEFKERITELKHDHGSPFFAYIPFSHLHVPLGFDSKFNNVTSSVFGDTVRELDESFEKMIGFLKESDFYDNSMIWLLGDNGPWQQECQYGGSPGPYRGTWQKKHGGGGASWKLTVWEGGHRVPAAVSWPNHIKQNVVSDALVSSMDILPTITNIIGGHLPIDRHYDGMDITDVLLHEAKEAHRVLFHPPFNDNGNITAVRYLNYKAIFETGGQPYLDCQLQKGPHIYHNPPLLFDLDSDPGEEYPLDSTHAQYDLLIDQIILYRDLQLQDISKDMRSKVDTRFNPKVKPCCNIKDPICRCAQ